MRRKRVIYRATHRGTKEADAVIGGFFRGRTLAEMELAEAEALLEVADPDLMDWVMGRRAIPPEWQRPLVHEVAAYYRSLNGGVTEDK